jgi:hypothetical protein
MSKRNETLLDDALDFIGREAQDLVLDAVYCSLFNKAGELEGNTAASDIEWFAQRIWERTRGNAFGNWNNLAEDTREFYREVARASLEALPVLMERIAARCRTQAQAVRTLLEANRRANKKSRG